MPRAPAHTIVAWLSVGVIALIAYGSLYPFNLKHTTDFDVWQAMSQLAWARAGRVDRISNVLLYAPLGFCIFLYCNSRWRSFVAAIVALLLGATLSLAIEVAQVFISSRVPSLWDVTFNTCGTAAGVICGMAWRILSARLVRSDAGASHDTTGAWWVLALWLGWRWAPFIPQLTLVKFKAALQPLTNPEFDTWQSVHYLVWWLVIAQLVFAIVSRLRATETLLAVIAATLIGRLFFAEPALIAAELLALVLLLPSLVVLHRLSSTPRQWLLFALVAALLVGEALMPWEFLQSARPLDLWPFKDWLAMGMPIDLPWLLQQVFLFGALAWLLNSLAVSLRVITYGVPLAVLMLALLQLWLPHSHHVLIEPILAVIVVFSLKMLWTTKSRATNRLRGRSR